MNEPQRKVSGPTAGQAGYPESGELERRSWRNWLFLVLMSVVTTVGLALAIPPLLGRPDLQVWPWLQTEPVLLAGFCILVAVFAAYLTDQQRQIRTVRKQLLQATSDTNERMRRQYDRLLALFGMSRIMTTETSPQNVFDAITKTCVGHFDAQWASLMVFQEKSQELVVRSTFGYPDSPGIVGRRKRLGEGIAGWAAKNRQPLLLGGNHDIALYHGVKLSDPSISTSMVVPIVLREELIGVINVSTRDPSVEYDDEDIQMLRVFAQNAGACMRHAEHVNWLRQVVQSFRDDSTRQRSRKEASQP